MVGPLGGLAATMRRMSMRPSQAIYCSNYQSNHRVLGLKRIFAGHFTRNPASGRVMQKAGMAYEGCFRKHHKKWGVFEDLAYYGIIRADYDSQTRVTL